MTSYSIYLHIPFCQHRCNYCDFNTYAGLEELIPAYTQALIKEIQFLVADLDQPLPVHTIFFGGGTPSLLPSDALEKLLQTLNSAFHFETPLEITLEANPGTLSKSYLQALNEMGFNRISLGMQSAHPGELAFLERGHNYVDVVEAVKWARQVGFDNLSLDLIFGLPEQPLTVWRDTLNLALSLNPEHFSLYALTIEQGTPLGRWADRGLIPEPDSDLSADMYELACNTLSMKGFVQYEISNWAKMLSTNLQIPTINPQIACQHNLQYWRNQPYIGLGAGAHGYVDGLRTQNILSPRAYIQRLIDEAEVSLGYPRTPATVQATQIDTRTEMRETMMMGLRLTRTGVSDLEFRDRFGLSMRTVFGEIINQLVDYELLEWVEETLRLTPKGRLLGNQVFMQFV